jgi:hypothetical protein
MLSRSGNDFVSSHDMSKHRRLTREFLWRVSLTTIGVLMGILATPLFETPKWLVVVAANTGASADLLLNAICVVIFGGGGFVAGGVYGRFRDRLAAENAGMRSEFKLSLWHVAIGVLAAILLLLLLGFCLLPPVRR